MPIDGKFRKIHRKLNWKGARTKMINYCTLRTHINNVSIPKQSQIGTYIATVGLKLSSEQETQINNSYKKSCLLLDTEEIIANNQKHIVG